MKKIVLILSLLASFSTFALPVYTYDPAVTHTQSVSPKWRWNLASGQEVKDEGYYLPTSLGMLTAWQQVMVCLKSFPGQGDVAAGITSPMLPSDLIAAQISLINMDAATLGEYYFNTALNSWNHQCETFTFTNGLHLFHSIKVMVKAHNLGTNTAPAMITMTVLGQ